MKSRRKAAAKVFFLAFHTLMTVQTTLLRFNHLDWGEDLFTDTERAYLDRLRTRINKDSEACRKFAQRLEGR